MQLQCTSSIQQNLPFYDLQKYSEPRKGESDKHYKARMDKNRKTNSDDKDGLHETVYWYDQCRYREANGGSFLAITQT